MSAESIASTRQQANIFVPFLIAIFILAYGIGVVAYQALALAGLLAAMLFAVYVFNPAIGVYLTAALLLLQGSAGIIGFFNADAPMALTLAQLAGVAAMAAWLANLLLSRVPFRYNGIVIAIGAYMLWSLLCTVISPERTEELPHWLRLLARFAFFLLVINVIDTPQKLRHYLYVVLFCGFIMTLVALAQSFLPQLQDSGPAAWASLSRVDAAYVDQESLQGEAAIRVSGTAGHSNWLALVLLLILPLNAWWFTQAKSLPHRTFVVLVSALEIVALALTYTRTGLLIGSVLVLLVLVRQVVKFSVLRVFAFLLACVIAFAALPDAYRERVLSPKQYTQSRSVKSRVELQEAAMRYTAQNPIFGLGMGGFGEEFIHENKSTAAVMELMVRMAGWQPVFIGTHNMYLQLSADTGLVGLAIFLLFLYMLIRAVLTAERLAKARDDAQGRMIAATLLISLFAFLLCGVFLHALHQDIWWMLAAAAVALYMYRMDFRPAPVATANTP